MKNVPPTYLKNLKSIAVDSRTNLSHIKIKNTSNVRFVDTINILQCILF